MVEWDTQYLVQDRIEIVDGACEEQAREVFGCFSDFSPHPPEVLTVKDCVRFSSNVCTIKIGQDLGKENLVDYLDAFGYGEVTGIDYPGERPWNGQPPQRMPDLSGFGFDRVFHFRIPSTDGSGLRDHRQRRRTDDAPAGDWDRER